MEEYYSWTDGKKETVIMHCSMKTPRFFSVLAGAFFLTAAAGTLGAVVTNHTGLAGTAGFMGKTALPDQVPLLNRRERFFVGNGIAGGGGDGDGRWNFLVGQDYTCPNYFGQ